MPTKPKNSDYIRIEEVPMLLLELTGTTRCKATVYNWVKKGRPDYLGENIKLKTSRRLGGLYTTKKWVLEFIRGIG